MILIDGVFIMMELLLNNLIVSFPFIGAVIAVLLLNCGGDWSEWRNDYNCLLKIALVIILCPVILFFWWLCLSLYVGMNDFWQSVFWWGSLVIDVVIVPCIAVWVFYKVLYAVVGAQLKRK